MLPHRVACGYNSFRPHKEAEQVGRCEITDEGSNATGGLAWPCRRYGGGPGRKWLQVREGTVPPQRHSEGKIDKARMGGRARTTVPAARAHQLQDVGYLIWVCESG